MSGERALAGKTVLVVEDDFFQADDARLALEGAGAEVVGPFPDAKRGIEALQGRRFDCALLDVNLGAGISFETARAAAGSGVPIVFMTGYDQESIAPEFGQVERLQKPVSARMLVEAVSRACQNRKQGDAV